ncbi:MAG: dTMP kinase [Planctomycetota bacterium]
MKAIFVAIEGVDGAGKSTQVELLRRRVSRRGGNPLVVREPGGTALGEAVRGILLDRGEIPISTEAELLLFLASRVQLHEEVIAPAVAEGRFVLSDRYHLSTVVYQGIAGDLGERRAVEICHRVLGERRPDLHLVIDTPLDDCLRRLAGRTDRFEGSPERLSRAHAGFRETSGLPGDRIERVDGRGAPEEVAARVWKRVLDAL